MLEQGTNLLMQVREDAVDALEVAISGGILVWGKVELVTDLHQHPVRDR